MIVILLLVSHICNPNSFVLCSKVYPGIQPSASTIKPIRPKRDMGPLLPFEELVNEDVSVDEPFKQEEDNKDDTNKDCNLPNPCALLHVTNRKKAPSLKKRLSMVCDVRCLINIFISSIFSSLYFISSIFSSLYTNILQIGGGQQISRIAGRI